jgi:hypothetical protein
MNKYDGYPVSPRVIICIDFYGLNLGVPSHFPQVGEQTHKSFPKKDTIQRNGEKLRRIES